MVGKWNDPKAQLDAARTSSSAEDLRTLATSPHGFVLVAVAENAATEADVLASLCPTGIDSYRKQELARAIARNANASPSTLERLADELLPLLDNGRDHQVAFEAGVVLCCSPRTPAAVVRALLTSPHAAMQFRKVVARETRRDDALAALREDRSSKVREQAERTAREIGDAPDV